MELTTQQVAKRLGYRSTKPIKNIVEEGLLTPVNQRAPGAKKFFMKFDSKDVASYIRLRRETGTALKKPAPAADPEERVSLLDALRAIRVEAQNRLADIDQLISKLNEERTLILQMFPEFEKGMGTVHNIAAGK